MNDELWIKLMKIGAHCGCHQRPDRSLFIKGYQFPICARCTGILFSRPIGIWCFVKKKCSFWLSLLLVLPMAIDGTIQLAEIYKSTNRRRFVTGFLAGIGMTYIELKALVLMAERLIKIFKR